MESTWNAWGSVKSSIDCEHFSEGNDLFVVHDSQGFEHGEESQLKTVQEFIERHSKEQELKKKLHAIWCVSRLSSVGWWLSGIAFQAVFGGTSLGQPFARGRKYRVLMAEI